MSGLKG